MGPKKVSPQRCQCIGRRGLKLSTVALGEGIREDRGAIRAVSTTTLTLRST